MNTVAFGDLFKFIRNGMNIRQGKSADGLPITRIETISTSIVNPSRVGYAGISHGDTGQWLLEDGDILFSHINSVEHIGKCAVYRKSPELLVHGMNLLCLRCKPDILIPDYAAHMIRSQGFRAKLLPFVNRAVNQASISIGNLKRIFVSIPSPEEQQRIAQILDNVDTLRAKRRAAIALVGNFIQTIFANTFGNPLENPHGYATKPLVDWVDRLRPITYGILKPGENQADGVKYVRVVDMKNGGIDLNGIRMTTIEISNQYKRSLLRSNDLLMSIRGNVGRLAQIPPSLEGANITQDSARIAVPEDSSRYVMELLRSPAVQHWMARRTKGAAVKGINLGDIKTLELPEPPIRLQKKFAAEAACVDQLNDNERTHLAELDALFASLQHRVFRGELCGAPAV